MTEQAEGSRASAVDDRRSAAIESIQAAQRSATELDAEYAQYDRRVRQSSARRSAPSAHVAGHSASQRPAPRAARHAPPAVAARRPVTRRPSDADAHAAASPPPALAEPEAADDLLATQRSYDAYEDGGDSTPTMLGRTRRFVQRYGWRAYALPILIVVTVVALASSDKIPRRASSTSASSPSHSPVAQAPAAALPSSQLKVDAPGAGAVDEPLVSDVLPAGAAYTTTGNGKFTVLPGTSPVIGHGQLFKYTVDVEGGVTGVDLAKFAATVDSTLANPHSWIAAGNVSLQRVSTSSQADFHVSLTSSMTVRKYCGYDIPVETSCYDSNSRRVVENVARWVRGDLAYVGDLATYHLYMINHEVGHALGHSHSHVCLSNGLAPAMMQQTLGLKSITGQICQSNPWPYPVGATDAPGVESADTPANSPIQVPGN
ncbi:Ribosome assembly protein YihI, activator of Der GTPase [Frankineae bacterium MT45]|nr:Ribosome assembly protein YihI, activator of Der GTPase [Frankineae bacterium MT45]